MIETDVPEEAENTRHGAAAIPIRNIWHMLLYAWRQEGLIKKWQGEAESAPSLDALLGSILCDMLRQRLRTGLGRSYTQEQKRLRGIRGRVDFTKSLRKLAFENGKAFCRYQEYGPNVPKNQIVRSTLSRLVQIGNFGPDKARAEGLRQQMRRLVRDLDGIDIIDVSLDMISRQTLGRNENDYRLMLLICELLIRRHMPTEFSSQSSMIGMNRDDHTLHNVYESFVANFYKLHMPAWIVKSQASLDWHATKGSPHLPAMRPDLIFQHKVSGKTVILDTKFTPHSLRTNPFGQDKFSSDALYQMYAYLRTQEHLSGRHKNGTAILLYPTVRATLSECVEMQGHQIIIRTIDLAAPWQEIEADLLKIMAFEDTLETANSNERERSYAAI